MQRFFSEYNVSTTLPKLLCSPSQAQTMGRWLPFGRLNSHQNFVICNFGRSGGSEEEEENVVVSMSLSKLKFVMTPCFWMSFLYTYLATYPVCPMTGYLYLRPFFFFELISKNYKENHREGTPTSMASVSSTVSGSWNPLQHRI